ncbi:hypothetical protein YC2023_040424 [Brassica napus]
MCVHNQKQIFMNTLFGSITIFVGFPSINEINCKSYVVQVQQHKRPQVHQHNKPIVKSQLQDKPPTFTKDRAQGGCAQRTIKQSIQLLIVKSQLQDKPPTFTKDRAQGGCAQGTIKQSIQLANRFSPLLMASC